MRIKKATIRFFSLFLIIFLFIQLLPNAHAVTSQWQPRITNFPRVNFNNNTTGAQVGILQKFLYCYNSVTRANIVAGGGIDLIFGQYTDTALRAFQQEQNLVVDGDCWTSSWSCIASLLTDSVENSYYPDNLWYFYHTSNLGFHIIMGCVNNVLYSNMFVYYPYNENDVLMNYNMVLFQQ